MSVIEQYTLLRERLLRVECFATPSQFTKFLSVAIRDFDLKFKTVRSDKLEPDMIVFNGLYDPEEDKQLFPCIDIEVLYFVDQKEIAVKSLDVDSILCDLYKAIYHEKIHEGQYRGRKFSRPKIKNLGSEDATYLGNNDEIEAYAGEIAIETYLLGLDADSIKSNKIYELYESTFGANHKTLEKLLFDSVKYYNKLTGEHHVLY